MAVNYGSLPFKEAIEFFQGKVNLPTKSWTDIWEGMHARAFVIAGATRDELLSDFRGAIDKAISDGTTIETFRQDFDAIVKKHGWSYNGGRGWRTRVIYDTNLRTAHMAGRYKQMKAVSNTRPYWEYKHSDYVTHPRPEHQSWDGMILRYDDPFWDTHFPPNGWGCKCRVNTLSDRDMLKKGKAAPDKAPDINWQTTTVGSRGDNPRVVQTPEGIDPGWGYNVGQAAWGSVISKRTIEKYRQGNGWKNITGGSWKTYHLPELLTPHHIDVPVKRLTKSEQIPGFIADLIESDERVFTITADEFTYPVLINAKSLGSHIKKDLGRARYLNYLTLLLDEPDEIWQTFERSEKTNKIALKLKLIKVLQIKGETKSVLLVVNAHEGKLSGWTFMPREIRKINQIRQGKLVYAREN